MSPILQGRHHHQSSNSDGNERIPHEIACDSARFAAEESFAFKPPSSLDEGASNFSGHGTPVVGLSPNPHCWRLGLITCLHGGEAVTQTLPFQGRMRGHTAMKGALGLLSPVRVTALRNRANRKPDNANALLTFFSRMSFPCVTSQEV